MRTGHISLLGILHFCLRHRDTWALQPGAFLIFRPVLGDLIFGWRKFDCPFGFNIGEILACLLIERDSIDPIAAKPGFILLSVGHFVVRNTVLWVLQVVSLLETEANNLAHSRDDRF